MKAYTNAELYEMFVERTTAPEAISAMSTTEIAVFVTNQLDGSEYNAERFPLDSDGIVDSQIVAEMIQAEARKMMDTYIFEHGDDKQEFTSIAAMAAYANAQDGSDGREMRYYAIEDGEYRPLTTEEFAELEA